MELEHVRHTTFWRQALSRGYLQSISDLSPLSYTFSLANLSSPLDDYNVRPPYLLHMVLNDRLNVLDLGHVDYQLAGRGINP